MHYRFYTTSKKAWAGMLAAIDAAHESIYLEMYTFENDTRGYDFVAALERKARAGVRVIIVLDALGSFMFKSVLIDRLRSAGAEVLLFSYWFRRTHRKMLITDEAVAFLGGVNIAHRFAHWNDLQVRVSGKIVRHVLRSFIRIYHECGGTNPALREEKNLPLLKKAQLWFIEHGIESKRHTLRKHYEEHINGAVRSVVIITPYLLPHRWLIACLERAIKRGVAVSIVVPKETDAKVYGRLNYYYVDLFTRLGATCFLGRGMNHAKVMLIDDRVGTVGSQNLDALSFDWNVEAGVFFNDPRMVRDLRFIIGKWMRDTVPFTSRMHPPRWYDNALGLFLRMFQPVL